MNILRNAALAIGLTLAATPAAYAANTATSFDMEAYAGTKAATQQQILDARTATFVEFDTAVGLPDLQMDYTPAELQKWVGNNPQIASVFDSSNHDPLDVKAATFKDGNLMLFVEAGSDNDATS